MHRQMRSTQHRNARGHDLLGRRMPGLYMLPKASVAPVRALPGSNGLKRLGDYSQGAPGVQGVDQWSWRENVKTAGIRRAGTEPASRLRRLRPPWYSSECGSSVRGAPGAPARWASACAPGRFLGRVGSNGRAPRRSGAGSCAPSGPTRGALRLALSPCDASRRRGSLELALIGRPADRGSARGPWRGHHWRIAPTRLGHCGAENTVRADHEDRQQDDDHAQECLGQGHVAVNADEFCRHEPEQFNQRENQHKPDDEPDPDVCHDAVLGEWRSVCCSRSAVTCMNLSTRALPGPSGHA